MKAAGTAVPARAEKGSGNHEGPGSTEAIGSLLNPADDSVTRLLPLPQPLRIQPLISGRNPSSETVPPKGF